MAFQVQKQFIPGNDQIWVVQLTPDDDIFQYARKSTADKKAAALQEADTDGRKYIVVEV